MHIYIYMYIYRVRRFQRYAYGMNCSFDKFVLKFVLSLPARSADSDKHSRYFK